MKYLKLFEDKKELEELSNKINSFDLETQYKDVKENKKNKDTLDKIDNILKNTILKKVIKKFNLGDTDNFKFYKSIRRRTLPPNIDKGIKFNIDTLTIKYNNIKGITIYIRIEQIYDKNTNELSYKILIMNFTLYGYHHSKRVISLLSDLRKLNPDNRIKKEELYELLKNIKDIINEIDFELTLNKYNL